MMLKPSSPHHDADRDEDRRENEAPETEFGAKVATPAFSDGVSNPIAERSTSQSTEDGCY